MEWISVNDKLPEIKGHTSDDILIYDKKWGVFIGYLYKYNDENPIIWEIKNTQLFCSIKNENITHWMPLPEIPKIK